MTYNQIINGRFLFLFIWMHCLVPQNSGRDDLSNVIYLGAIKVWILQNKFV